MVKKFPGFPPERQYWQFPTIINGHVNLLSGTEFKVLWYILRHTFGYQKDEDAISIPQIMNGIKKKDGTIIDSGTGIKHRQTVVKALKRLAKMGFISRKSQGGKGKANIFRPIIQNTTPPTEYTPPPSKKHTPPPLQEIDPTIDNTIDNKQYREKALTKKTKNYSSIKHILGEDLEEISQRYKVPLSFVKLQFEKMSNWCEAKGKVYKNYKKALMNWVLREAEGKVERGASDKYRGVDARHIR